jgi:transcriptional regulator with XRE-family HTH domain
VAQLWSTAHIGWVPKQTHREPQRLFGIVLRQLRQKLDKSQDAFAHSTGYHRNYIGQLERGEKSPSLKALFDFAEAFDMLPSELLEMMEKQAGLKPAGKVAKEARP